MPPAAEIARLPFLLLRDSWREQSMIHYFMVQGPARGPNAFPNFAEVVASGVSRPDSPPTRSRDVTYSMTEWRGLATIVGGVWFASATPQSSG